MNIYLEKSHFCMLQNSMYYGLNCKPKPQKKCEFLLKKILLRNLVVILGIVCDDFPNV